MHDNGGVSVGSCTPHNQDAEPSVPERFLRGEGTIPVEFCPACGSAWLGGCWGDSRLFGCDDCGARFSRQIEGDHRAVPGSSPNV